MIITAVPLITGGALHLRDWLRTYRGVPWEVPGAWVVRVGFPVNAAVSVAFAVVLVVAAARSWSVARWVVAGAIGFQASSIAALALSRGSGVFGWVEPGWTVEARQILTLEIATIIGLALTYVAYLSSARATRPVFG
jgi:hypothetical protein